MRATLEASGRGGEKAIEALLERAKNELREATALRASERVGELVSPVTQKLTEFDRLINILIRGLEARDEEGRSLFLERTRPAGAATD